MSMRRMRTVAVMIAAALVVAACGGSDDHVSVTDQWARQTAPGTTTAAFYATFENGTGTDDWIVDGYSPQCGRVEMHHATVTDGVMSMQPATALELFLADGDQLVLEPAGLHVMCIDTPEPFAEGDTVSLELTFENTGVIVFDVPVEQR